MLRLRDVLGQIPINRCILFKYECIFYITQPSDSLKILEFSSSLISSSVPIVSFHPFTTPLLKLCHVKHLAELPNQSFRRCENLLQSNDKSIRKLPCNSLRHPINRISQTELERIVLIKPRDPSLAESPILFFLLGLRDRILGAIDLELAGDPARHMVDPGCGPGIGRPVGAFMSDAAKAIGLEGHAVELLLLDQVHEIDVCH